MSETVLAYEIALRTLDKRDLASTRLFIDIARTLREIEPPKRSKGLPFRFKLPSLHKKDPRPRY
ncbi:hypothetical protein A3K80_03755 [Candidatus Bathyarchaeota archaeon RBG_13_38_9]|nr:MAG: hypothetical protein A3K80_03755 [Candidatus Bathyarchaeota archaeon RBG_13_38_9]